MSWEAKLLNSFQSLAGEAIPFDRNIPNSQFPFPISQFPFQSLNYLKPNRLKRILAGFIYFLFLKT